ncbi:MAG TPA: UbiA family prenyltransferase, partial [Anseongella sp.]|nr:UbiA family prenyltransferase [Anseongella sp.]
WFDFLIFSNTFIALCAVAQGWLTYMLLGAAPDMEVLVLLYFATAFVYNAQAVLNKIPRDGTSVYYRIDWLIRNRKLIRTLSFTAAGGVLASAFFLQKATWIALAVTGLLAVFYSFPLLKTGGLRQVPGLKLFLIAGVWASACVLIPYFESGVELETARLGMLWLKRFLFIAAITLPFDIKDIETDRAWGLKTLPALLGVKGAVMLSLFFLLVYLLLLQGIRQPDQPASFYGLLATALLAAVLILSSTRQRKVYFYLFVFDGILILQPLLVLCFRLAGDAV